MNAPVNHHPVPTEDAADEAPHDGSYDVLVSPEVAAAGHMAMSQGHRCCGGCCDMRRAIIIVNLIDVAICVFYAVYFAFLAKAVEDDSMENKFDAATQAKVEGIMLKAEHVFIILALIKTPLNGLGMYGALKFTAWPVMVALVAYCVEVVMTLFARNIGGLFLAGFFAYPHVVFLRQLKSGIMSEANYPTEKHSCCCV